jgi:hypothetical protein
MKLTADISSAIKSGQIQKLPTGIIGKSKPYFQKSVRMQLLLIRRLDGDRAKSRFCNAGVVGCLVDL